MIIEYVIFNIVVIAGPVALSFDKKVQYFKRWKIAISAIFITLIPFFIWDVLVTNRHWWFNDSFTLPFRIFGLPIGELLFFITVPFAVLFIWDIMDIKKDRIYKNNLQLIEYFLLALAIPGIIFYLSGKEYTGLTLLSLAAVVLIDKILLTKIFRQFNTYYYLAIVSILILIFNGYLTARPVVLYGEQFQLGLRIFTIPIEDFGFGFSLILLNTILYEKFKGIWNGKNG